MFNQDHAVRGVWLGLAGVKRLLEAWVKRCWRTSKDNVWSSGQFLCDYMSEPVYYSAGSNTWGIRNLSGRINRGSQLCDFIKYDLTITPLNTTATLFYFIISYFPRQICQSCWQPQMIQYLGLWRSYVMPSHALCLTATLCDRTLCIKMHIYTTDCLLRCAAVHIYSSHIQAMLCVVRESAYY